MAKRAVLGVATLASLAVVLACSPVIESRDLASEFDPSQVRVSSGAQTPFVRYDVISEAGGDYLRIPVGDGTPRPWGEFPRPHVARAYVPSLAMLTDWQLGDRLPGLFDGDGAAFEHSHYWSLDANFDAEPGAKRFTSVGAELLVWGEPARLGSLELHVPVQRGERVSGRWRTQLGHLVADGFQLWPGEEWSIERKASGPRELTFLFAALGHAIVEPGTEQHARWRIHLDGKPFDEGELLVQPGQPVWTPVHVELPREGRELRFEVEGRGARMAFLAPRLADARSKSDRRKDVAIFLADTFRADLVGQRVGERSLTPHINSFAETAVRFEQARSPSSWTLPAHASLFTALQPTTHGALGYEDQLAVEAPRLAERMRAMGYRTAAITNGGFVSRAFGLDRGFDFFFEHRADNHIEGLIDLVPSLLEWRDPRPLFVFFHTYRAHDPYWLETSTRAELASSLPLGREWPQLRDVLRAVAPNVQHGEPVPPGFEGELEELRALYLGGAMDVDRGFGRWLHLVDGTGRDNVVVFTSDHGESFGERDGRIGHHLGPFEDQLRVPLIVRAPGIAPHAVHAPATLMDLPRTLFAILDLSPSPEWRGTNLFAPARATEAPLLLYTEPTQVAWIEGSRKLVALGDGLEERRVYDIDADPLELTDLVADHRDWATERIARLLEDTSWRQPRWAAEAAVLSSEQQSQLHALGYTAGD